MKRNYIRLAYVRVFVCLFVLVVAYVARQRLIKMNEIGIGIGDVADALLFRVYI